MSVGNNLQEMENVVTKGAAPAETMPSAGIPVEDLGGPTPENSSPFDGSNALATPGATLKQVKDVVNAKATPGDASTAKEETEVDETQEVVSEEEATTEDVVSEEEVAAEEVVAEAEEEITEEETIDIEADVQALLEGEELSEEFQDKARTIFEAAVKSKVAEMKDALHETYQNALVEEVASIREELSDRMDSYLEYVADEWFQENVLAVEQGLKNEISESFITGMKGLFEEHYVSIPDEKYDVLESMVEKLDEMEEKLNEQIEKNISLNGRLSEATADGILDKVSEGLATTQKEKLASLSESVEFESEEQYREKLEMLKESYFAEKTSTASKTETLSEGVDSSPEFVSGSMNAYLKTLSSFGK